MDGTVAREPDPLWDGFPINSRPLGELFALAPKGLTRKYLLRHRCLNPADVRLSDSDLLDLDNLMARHRAILKAASDNVQLCASRRTKELLAGNQLTELTIDVVPQESREAFVAEARARSAMAQKSFGIEENGDANAVQSELERTAGVHVPNAVRCIRKGGRTYVATVDQFGDDIRELQAIYASCRRDYFYEVIAWFVGRGLTATDLLIPELEAFEVLNNQGPWTK
ncbi:MAG: hypothetical protein R3F29_10070 [Planctomycetota bacterium]